MNGQGGQCETVQLLFIDRGTSNLPGDSRCLTVLMCTPVDQIVQDFSSLYGIWGYVLAGQSQRTVEFSHQSFGKVLASITSFCQL